MDIPQIIRFAARLDYSKESVNSLYEYLLAQFELKRPQERAFQKRGTLITFEGHSGAGKDTQIRLLMQHMEETYCPQGYKAIELIQKREDPWRIVEKYLWEHPQTKAAQDCSILFLTTARRFFVFSKLLPILEDMYNIAIVNRSFLSNIAYHAQTVEELPSLIALSDFDPQADLAFVLECSAEIAYSRVVERSPQKGGRIYPNEKPSFTRRVQKNFRALESLVSGLIFIDSSLDVDSISQSINNKVNQYF